MTQPRQPVAARLHHMGRMRQMLLDLVQHAREDIQEVNEPRAQALLETTAEVLEGLARAYDHPERRNEPAWRQSGRQSESERRGGGTG